MTDAISRSLFERAAARHPRRREQPGARVPRRRRHARSSSSRAEGAYLYGADGAQYIDYVGSWGPMILGHAHPAVVARDRARRPQRGTSYGAPTELEVRFAETIMRALPVDRDGARRLERHRGDDERASASRAASPGATSIVKFEGCYHGHADFLLVKAGCGAATLRRPRLGRRPGGDRAQTR